MYAQLVEGKGPKSYVDAMLSNPYRDIDAFLEELLEAGADVYVVRRSEDTRENQLTKYHLQLLAPYVVQSMTTDRRPLPEFKDLLVPRGAVFKVVEEIPDLRVPVIPPDHQLDTSFEGPLMLRGFHIDHASIAPGDFFHATYYWSLEASTKQDYWVDILFTDEDGFVETEAGLPTWLHSHWIGSGAYPTSEWASDSIMRESYDGLVPRGVTLGTYYIRAYIYRDGPREIFVPVTDPSSDDGGVLLGTIHIEDE